MSQQPTASFAQWIVVAALLAGAGVAAGAFGAHGLKSLVTPERLAVFETAVRYQLVHALAILFAAAFMQSSDSRLPRHAAFCFSVGTVLFSGSLYALVLTDTPQLGAVTPVGGVFFLLGWAILAAWGVSQRRLPRTAA